MNSRVFLRLGTVDELRELDWIAEPSGTAMWLEPTTSPMTQGRISFVPFGLVDVVAVLTRSGAR